MVMRVGDSLVPLELVPLEKQLPLSSQVSVFDDLLHGFDYFLLDSGELNQGMGTILVRDDNAANFSTNEGSLIDHLERIKADRHYESLEVNETPLAKASLNVEHLAKTLAEENVQVKSRVAIENEIQHIVTDEDDSLLTQMSPLPRNSIEKAVTEMGAQQGNYFHRLRSTGTMVNILTAVQSQPAIDGDHLQSLALVHPEILEGKLIIPSYRVPFEPLGQQRMAESLNTHFVQVNSAKTKQAKEKSVYKLHFSNRLPMTEEIANSFIKTVSNSDKIKVYYRDYTGITDGRLIQQMIDVLHRSSGKPVSITFNGKTEVFYGSTTGQ
ncbi:hypothetical protein [Vibrio metschnikovii]|uniref:hypothetical protein n=1 Tax=Vibrio metschnikovii TaxID=28172 RepID=UPI001C2F63E3|nr:hypothetical protein [Vibrio metschnikovii]